MEYEKKLAEEVKRIKADLEAQMGCAAFTKDKEVDKDNISLPMRSKRKTEEWMMRRRLLRELLHDLFLAHWSRKQRWI